MSIVMRRLRYALAVSSALFLGMLIAEGLEARGQPTVVELTQTGCQFVEPEGRDRLYETTKKADCDAVNAKTGADRLAEANVLKLRPGKYIFRVTNKNVPYDLGFWLRGKGLGRLTLPSVSGGGLTTGATRDYVVTLKAGEYLYSCPLNPTPDYRLVVDN